MVPLLFGVGVADVNRVADERTLIVERRTGRDGVRPSPGNRPLHAAGGLGIDALVLQFQPFESEQRRFAHEVIPHYRKLAGQE